MLIYVISSPDDDCILLTVDPKQLARATRPGMEIQTWDTDAAPGCLINLDIKGTE